MSRRFGSAQVLNGDDSSVNYDSSSPVTSRKPMTSTPKVRYVKECEGCRDIKGRSRLSSSEEFKRPTANQKTQITLTNQKQETQVRTREFNTQTFEPLTHRNGTFIILRYDDVIITSLKCMTHTWQKLTNKKRKNSSISTNGHMFSPNLRTICWITCPEN